MSQTSIPPLPQEDVQQKLQEGQESGISDRTPDDIMQAVLQKKKPL